METKKRFNAINGLRTICIIGILNVHIYFNLNLNFDNIIFNKLLTFFTSFVFLFMIISGFGMCCGYYDKIKNNKITPNEFYKKRYDKIWPFFAILVLFDVIISHNLSAIYEGFANLTLVFAFLPNPHIEVIGVAWTLGVIFAFYMLFPFFVFLLDNKKRAWFSLVIAILLNFACVTYFFSDKFVVDSFSPRINILYCAIFFIVGGIIYLYKESIINNLSKYKNIILLLCWLTTIMFCVLPEMSILTSIEVSIVFSLWLIYCIISNGKILDNKITKFISSISLEIYLSHMIIFRIVEKLKIPYMFKNECISYIITYSCTVFGVILFSVIAKKIIEKVIKK